MKIILYKLFGENERVDKTNYMMLYTQITGYLRSQTSITHPSIQVESDSFLDCNYAYIEEFSRYYFIREIISIRNNLWQLELDCDVLMSFKDRILSLTAFVSRNQYIYNEKLIDKLEPLYPSYSVNKITKKEYALFDIIKENSSEKSDEFTIYVVCSSVRYTTANYTDGYSAFPHNLYNTPSSYYSPYNHNIVVYAFKGTLAIQWLLGKFIENDDIPNYILSIYIAPFSDYCINNFLSFEEISYASYGVIIGSYRVGEKGDVNNVYVAHVKNDIPVVTIDLDIIQDFKCFEPYRQLDIYLPFYGYLDLDTNTIFGTGKDNITSAKLLIYQSLDLTNGSILYNINVERVINGTTEYNHIKSVSGTFASELPITYTNATDVKRQSEANLLNFIGSSIQAYGYGASNITESYTRSGLVGALTGSVQMVGNISAQALGYLANERVNRVKGGVSTFTSSYNAYSSPLFIFLRDFKTNSALNNEESYRELVGKPTKQILSLGDLYGFTILDDFHLTSFHNATSEEKEILKNILLTGFYLPIKP
jgi:hypothetical protein